MLDTLHKFIEHPRFNQFIIALILINAMTLGLETNKDLMARCGVILMTIDKLILAIFTLEVIAKLIIYRLQFFKSGWNIFDFTIVSISLLPASGPLAILRSFRILRVLRIFSIVPQMRNVINGLFRALPGMTSVVGVIIVIFYISAVLVTKVFGTTGDPDLTALFGTLNASMFTLFQLMTLENWVDGIVKPAMSVYPLAWLFFIPFIIITSFAILNLFIGVIVEAMQYADKEEEAAKQNRQLDELKTEIRNLAEEIRELKRD